MSATPDRSITAPEAARTADGLPGHVAFIMDGNGRWAQARGLPRTEGHRHGLEALRRTVRHAVRLGLGYMTIYSFSSENWRRPETEVSFLMGLLRRFLQRDLSEIHNANVRIRVIGQREDLDSSILKLLTDAEALTRENSGMTLVVAFNYGARDEITRAIRRLAQEVASGELSPEAISEDALNASLDTAGIPDPDLIIRTSGERRLSNFLMWQAAYSELYFSPVLWPDFDREAFDAALDDYCGRDRRFGGLTAKAL
ncbi:isoprenyl transferase [Roseibium sp. RKSG952]|uniref:isoprenyl transferase n=1 Tax=Roseibium sp. RKSG952 TaxID=2529384 RepID=UPI0012BD6475|nr:isoprenyl transferase [Roseibium sp. RKSG952]MTH97876.1 isoprenyl transferase [Roseibium sp. RKSG952]